MVPERPVRDRLRFGGLVRGAACAALACLTGSGATAQPVRPAAAQEAKPATAPDGAVRTGCDAACTRQAVPAAIQACAPGIEAQAPTDFEWMNRPAGTIFQQAEPPAGGGATAKFRGDSIRFLSPQGQWVRITYECDYDVTAQAVRAVTVRLGRIDGKGANEGAPTRPSAGAAPAPVPAQNTAQAQAKRILPSEPSEVEIKQVAPSVRR